MRLYITIFLLFAGFCAVAQNHNGLAAPPESKPDTGILSVAEKMPEFKGPGTIMQYLAQNIKYPAEAQEQGIEGISVVVFVVDSTGIVSKADIKKTSGSKLLDDESIRVIKTMRFIPGEQKGVPVAVRYAIPVRYKLN